MRKPLSRAMPLAAPLLLAFALPVPAQAQDARTGTSFVETFEDEQLDRDRWYVSQGWVNTPDYDCTWSVDALSKPGDSLVFTVERAPTAERDFICAEVQSTDVFSYGTYEVRMRAARGQGVMSAFFTYTGPYFGDPHDEVDIELPGARPRSVEVNAYVDGSHGDIGQAVELGFDASQGFHDYAFEWTPEVIRFYVDGEQVGEITDPDRIPDTPGKIYLAVYSGRGQYEPWLGRFVETSETPTMTVERVAYTAPGEPCQFPESIVCGREP
ncbi:family 16 glycosylhydrolase [Salinarimonas rosea]|uniref:family 16 glycosylhydrolase n=1 Tax=Salinarimonas rosea TaxID=552063 RepID=UPI00040FAE21|nr:family 16 glycosylhydrolase [Salinarimonas rosea]